MPDEPAPTPDPGPANPARPDPADEAPRPEAMATDALDAAQQALSAISQGAEGDASPFSLPDFTESTARDLPSAISLLSDVNLNVKIELGRTRMLVDDVLRLASGSVVELDKLAGDPVDIYVNDRPVARGEILVLNDNFCVRVNEILSPISAEAAPAKNAQANDTRPATDAGEASKPAA
jgi:flagellar motor switch protein FliN/FliY